MIEDQKKFQAIIKVVSVTKKHKQGVLLISYMDSLKQVSVVYQISSAILSYVYKNMVKMVYKHLLKQLPNPMTT